MTTLSDGMGKAYRITENYKISMGEGSGSGGGGTVPPGAWNVAEVSGRNDFSADTNGGAMEAVSSAAVRIKV